MMKGLTKSLAMLIFSIITLAASAVAWFTMSNSNTTGNVDVLVSDFQAIVAFDVKKNDSEKYTSIKTINDMHNHFGYTLPGDVMHFKIEIENKGSREINSNLEIRNIYSTFDMVYEKYDPNYTANMLDIYYLVDGAIFLEKYDENNNLVEDISKNYPVSPINSDEVTLFEGTEFEIDLNNYRFSNIINKSNNLPLISNIKLAINEKFIVYFSIKYQTNDPLKNFKLYPDYTYGVFYLNSIYAFVT